MLADLAAVGEIGAGARGHDLLGVPGQADAVAVGAGHRRRDLVRTAGVDGDVAASEVLQATLADPGMDGRGEDGGQLRHRRRCYQFSPWRRRSPEDVQRFSVIRYPGD